MRIKTILFAIICAPFFLSSCSEKASVSVVNNSSIERVFEDVEIDWKQITKVLPRVTPQTLVVSSANIEQPYQIVYNQDKVPTAVLIQASLAPNQSQEFVFSQGIPKEVSPLTFGRIVPERKDDFAWENNRVAYRMYGPALEATGELSNGIDVWAKRTEDLIIDKWYKMGDYHVDRGEGMDYYKVGRSLGAGAVAPIFDNSLVLGNNFTGYHVFENGPLRTTFILNYAPLKVGKNTLNESRIISLSANSNFNKIVQVFEGDFDSVSAASGIVLREEQGVITVDEELGMISYQEPANAEKGELSIAVILGDAFQGSKQMQDHLVALTTIKNGEPLIYYMGNGWTKAGFSSDAEWIEYAKRYAKSIESPLEVVYN